MDNDRRCEALRVRFTVDGEADASEGGGCVDRRREGTDKGREGIMDIDRGFLLLKYSGLG